MPVFEPDRIKNQIMNDLMVKIRKDTHEIISDAAYKLEDMVDEMGGSKAKASINRVPNGTTAEITMNVPKNNVGAFIAGTNALVKGIFKFGNWSDMKI